jgi:hypothetical protein
MCASDEKLAEEAFDKAVSQFDQNKRKATNPKKYQFVGVRYVLERTSAPTRIVHGWQHGV